MSILEPERRTPLIIIFCLLLFYLAIILIQVHESVYNKYQDQVPEVREAGQFIRSRNMHFPEHERKKIGYSFPFTILLPLP